MAAPDRELLREYSRKTGATQRGHAKQIRASPLSSRLQQPSFNSGERQQPLSERDQHLDVMTCITTLDQRSTITSSVKVHNGFGRLSMSRVAPGTG